VRAWANRQSTIDNRPAAPARRAPEVHASENPARRRGARRRCTPARTRPAVQARTGGARQREPGPPPWRVPRVHAMQREWRTNFALNHPQLYIGCLGQAGCFGVLRARSATLARGCARRLERRATDRALGRGFTSWRTRIISSQSLASTCAIVCEPAWSNPQSTIDNRPAAPARRAPEVHAWPSKNPARRPGAHRRCTSRARMRRLLSGALQIERSAEGSLPGERVL